MKICLLGSISAIALMGLAFPSEAANGGWKQAWCNRAGGCFFVRVISREAYPVVAYEFKGSPSTGDTRIDRMRINCSTMQEESLTNGYKLNLNSPNVNPVHLDKAKLVCQ